MSLLSGSSSSQSSLLWLLSTSVLHLNVLRHHSHMTADRLLIKNGRWHLEKERGGKKTLCHISENTNNAKPWNPSPFLPSISSISNVFVFFFLFTQVSGFYFDIVYYELMLSLCDLFLLLLFISFVTLTARFPPCHFDFIIFFPFVVCVSPSKHLPHLSSLPLITPLPHPSPSLPGTVTGKFLLRRQRGKLVSSM